MNLVQDPEICCKIFCSNVLIPKTALSYLAFYRAEPNFGPKIWVELGQVGPTMDDMFLKCINVQVVFAGHNC